jgi:hypothetical protein
MHTQCSATRTGAASNAYRCGVRRATAALDHLPSHRLQQRSEQAMRVLPIACTRVCVIAGCIPGRKKLELRMRLIVATDASNEPWPVP